MGTGVTGDCFVPASALRYLTSVEDCERLSGRPLCIPRNHGLCRISDSTCPGEHLPPSDRPTLQAGQRPRLPAGPSEQTHRFSPQRARSRASL